MRRDQQTANGFWTIAAIVAAGWMVNFTDIASGGSTSASGAELTRPNFIVINIDDLGYGDIGPFGCQQARTPHLDRMAAEGRKLTCFYAAPVCSPSRAALMTGCYPKRALPIPHVLFPADESALHPDEITVAELLRGQKYATGIVGKWHLGDQPDVLPTEQGFDEYYGLPYSNDMGPAADGVKSNLGAPLKENRPNAKSQPPLPLIRNHTVIERVLPATQQQLVQRYTAEAISFVRRHAEEPFFLYLPHSAVHFPHYPSDEFHNRSGHGLMGDWIEEVDWSVGQLLDVVRSLKLAEKTLVLFTSDNGGSLPHGSFNGPLRGGKGSTFEGGMRVPTVAWWPGTIPAGTSSDAVIGMLDVLPTLVTLAGGQLPDDRRLDGIDVWPVLSGADNASGHDVFYFFRGLNLEAVRQGPWKLHLKSGELFHLVNDIAESQDVAAANADVVARLKSLAAAMDDDLGTTQIGPGCRKVKTYERPLPLIDMDGKIRAGFAP